MAGANMSGDLQNPAKSIPLGTISAVIVTGVIYIGLALLLASVRGHQELTEDMLIMKKVALIPWFVTAGVFAATLHPL